MKVLTIKLTAPLQSYGDEATFYRRTSTNHPSKSSIIGMISAALGYKRDDPRIVDLNELDFGVRVDQTGKYLNEFQVAYDRKKKKNNLIFRDFIQDAVYLVAIGSSNEELIEKIEKALKNPVYSLYLGRKSNPPAGPLKMQKQDVDSVLECLKKAEWQAALWFKKKMKRDKYYYADIYSDEKEDESVESFVKDKVGSFSEKNRYHSYRQENFMTVKLENDLFEDSDEFDVMEIFK